MNVKGGTQTWSSAPQRSDFKSDGTKTMSAIDQAKFGDGESMGDTLNKVADPNYVDPAKHMRTVGNNQLGKDAFMTLLLTQMKNQDPTNPLKSHEMAAQLAQFTSLEKLNNINDGISALRKDNQPDHNFQALAMIGKVVTMDNSKINRTDVAEAHDLRFNLAADAVKANIEVRDSAGNVVRKLELKNLKAGPNSISWNGKTEEGAVAGVGDYQLAVEAFGSNGRKLQVQTKADGIITGVNFTAHGAQLLMGKQAISMADVKSISEPGLTPPPTPNVPTPPAMGGSDAVSAIPGAAEALARMSAGQAGAGAAPSPAPRAPDKMIPIKPETKPNAAKAAALAKGNLNDSAMTQGLINTLNKEGAKAGMG